MLQADDRCLLIFLYVHHSESWSLLEFIVSAVKPSRLNLQELAMDGKPNFDRFFILSASH